MSFGHTSTDPCTVCGQHDDNRIEPRFSYTVCKAHQSVPPAHLDAARAAYHPPVQIVGYGGAAARKGGAK